MPNKWIIADHHLAIESEESVYHLLADDIFSYAFESEHSLPISNSPVDVFPGFRFSKVGSPIHCRLSFDKEKNAILFSAFTIRKKKEITVDIIEAQIIDQCVLENEWFYINGEVDEVNSLLSELNIQENGIISFKQYLSIIGLVANEGLSFVENSVDTDAVFSLPLNTTVIPSAVHANLFEYQRIGFSWMKYMLQENCGCILGDEMGLGKTLQVIAVLSDMKEHHRLPALVIAPVSLLENWKRECGKFAPDLDVFVHHGALRTGRFQELIAHDVVVISYNTAISDLSMIKMHKWALVVVDEAQNIKNYKSERAKAIKQIPRAGSIAVSGTPFENHITDIWSLVDFTIPGYLGSLSQYSRFVSDDVNGAAIVEPLLSPIMIRRRVKDVASDLPEKVIIPQPITMSDEEAKQYETYRQEVLSKMGDACQLSLLQKLRMHCTHPFLCQENYDVHTDPYVTSIKYQRMCEIVQNIVESNEKVLLFTSYKDMFDILYRDIPIRFNIPITCINGETLPSERQKIVDSFNEYEGPAMLALNPRAAGTGLNITGANHVIHYNLEWNPSLEDQASARAYRRGQAKTVFVYRLFYVDTVEEMVNNRLESKRKIANIAIIGNDGNNDSRADILAALDLSPINKEKQND